MRHAEAPPRKQELTAGLAEPTPDPQPPCRQGRYRTLAAQGCLPGTPLKLLEPLILLACVLFVPAFILFFRFSAHPRAAWLRCCFKGIWPLCCNTHSTTTKKNSCCQAVAASSRACCQARPLPCTPAVPHCPLAAVIPAPAAAVPPPAVAADPLAPAPTAPWPSIGQSCPEYDNKLLLRYFS